MLEKKYKVKSRLKICPSCQSMDVLSGKIFPPKKYDDNYLECTNPECLDVFNIIPMFEFSYCCPDCGFECPIEDEAYQIKDDGSWNVFPFEILKYNYSGKAVNEGSFSFENNIFANCMLREVEKSPVPDDLRGVNKPLEGKTIYPKYEDCTTNYEVGKSWWEIHYCPHCKQEYGFGNGD